MKASTWIEPIVVAGAIDFEIFNGTFAATEKTKQKRNVKQTKSCHREKGRDEERERERVDIYKRRLADSKIIQVAYSLAFFSVRSVTSGVTR